jgi:hypothetical protein
MNIIAKPNVKSITYGDCAVMMDRIPPIAVVVFPISIKRLAIFRLRLLFLHSFFINSLSVY